MKKFALGLLIAGLMIGTSFAAAEVRPSVYAPAKTSTSVVSSAAITSVTYTMPSSYYYSKTLMMTNSVAATDYISGTIEGSFDNSRYATIDASSLTGIGTGCAKTVTITNCLPYIKVKFGARTATTICTPELWLRSYGN